jgi:hypothetical protein
MVYADRACDATQHCLGSSGPTSPFLLRAVLKHAHLKTVH